MNVFADIFFSYMNPKKCIHDQLFDMNIFFTCKDMAKKSKYIRKKLFSDMYLYFRKVSTTNELLCSRIQPNECSLCFKIFTGTFFDYFNSYLCKMPSFENFEKYVSVNNKKPKHRLYGIQKPGQPKPNSMKDRRHSKINDHFPKINNKALKYNR